jgi:23S rRNA pseudouridine2605 synthase
MNDEVRQVRLNRYLASCGLGSRRHCDGLIVSGRIYVNGDKVARLGTRVVTGSDRVEYKGSVLSPIVKLSYVAYHKPRSVVVTKSDPEGRPTVFDSVRQNGFDAASLNYVGRLDVNSEGLLLFTNDGDIIHRLTHPRYHIKKVYEVMVDKKLSASHCALMKNEGVPSEGQVLHAGDIRPFGPTNECWYRIDLYEGKNRQIRRMLAVLGYGVLRLIRVQFGPVRLADLRPDTFRELTREEISALHAAGYPAGKHGPRTRGN